MAEEEVSRNGCVIDRGPLKKPEPRPIGAQNEHGRSPSR